MYRPRLPWPTLRQCRYNTFKSALAWMKRDDIVYFNRSCYERMNYSTHGSTSTVNEDELDKFRRIAASWWDPHGPFRLLHLMNAIRIPYILTHAQKDVSPLEYDISDHPSTFAVAAHMPRLSGIRLLDVGCGGGILSEPLARLGALVTGIDACRENILIAQEHQRQDRFLSSSSTLSYRHTTTQDLLKEKRGYFDIVVASEIIEHVDHPQLFLEELVQLCQPQGIVILSSINRTLLSKWTTIHIAEDVLRLVDKGTHDYNKFVKTDEIEAWLCSVGWTTKHLQGITYLPLIDQWMNIPFHAMNFILTASKRSIL